MALGVRLQLEFSHAETEENPFAQDGPFGRFLDRLDSREQTIIIRRYGLDRGLEPQTLKEVGSALGVTKERVRQIEAKALEKLRVAAQAEAERDRAIQELDEGSRFVVETCIRSNKARCLTAGEESSCTYKKLKVHEKQKFALL